MPAENTLKSIKVNAVLNVLKQLFSIIFPMLTVYYASRALGQEKYGAVNYIRSIVSYFHLFAGLGVSTYAIREGAAKRYRRQYFNAFVNEVFTTNVIATVIALAALVLFTLANAGSSIGNEIPLIIIFSFTVFIPTLGLDWVNTVYEDYAYLTVRYLIIHAVSLLLMFLLVHQPEDYNVYAGLIVLSTVGGNLFNILYVRRYVKARLCSPRRCLPHIAPILILFSSTIASTIYINSDTTIIGALIGNKAVAVYAVASQIYIAVKHISNSAIMVTVPRLAYYVGNEKGSEFKALIDKVADYALSILLPSIVGLFCVSDQIMVFMGGAEYASGAAALRILSLALFFAVAAYVLSRCVLIPHKEDKTYLTATVISAAVNITLNFYFVRKWSYTGAAVTTLISEIIVFGIFYYRSKKYYTAEINGHDLRVCLLACVPIVLVCKAAGLLIHSNHGYIAAAVSLSAVLYFAVLYAFSHPLMQDVKRIGRRIIRRGGRRNG